MIFFLKYVFDFIVYFFLYVTHAVTSLVVLPRVKVLQPKGMRKAKGEYKQGLSCSHASGRSAGSTGCLCSRFYTAELRHFALQH